MFDIITFGSATWDTFLRIKEEDFKIFQKEKKNYLSLLLGEKIYLEEILTESGGGGTNAAFTFANQGLKVAFCGKVGNDYFGEKVIQELKGNGIFTNFIKRDKTFPTNQSFILTIGSERTILMKEGASSFWREGDFSLSALKAKWYYLAPLHKRASLLTKKIILNALKKDIKIAINPSKDQILMKKFKALIKNIDVLILNLEEAKLLVNLSNEKQIIQELKKLGPKFILVTKGKEGAILIKDKFLYQVGTLNVKVVEKTGAGDAFASGFVAGLFQKNDVEYALQLATINASNCIQKIGAKQGLILKDEVKNWPKVNLSVQEVSS